MKKIILIVLSISTSTALAQKMRFSDTSNKWIYERLADCAQPSPVNYYKYGYYGDTVVNSLVYRRSTAGLIREDTTIGIVYIKNAVLLPNDTSEHVLYNYNMNIGDSLLYSYFDSSSFPAAVHLSSVLTKKDSIFYNGYWYRVQHFSHYMNNLQPLISFECMEGLGAISYHPWAPLAQDDECPARLICFANNGVTQKIQGLAYPGLCTVQVDDVISIPISYTVTPNPLNNSIVRLSRPIIKGALRIYNALGQCLFEMAINRRDEVSLKGIFPPPGIYVIEISDELRREKVYRHVVAH